MLNIGVALFLATVICFSAYIILILVVKTSISHHLKRYIFMRRKLIDKRKKTEKAISEYSEMLRNSKDYPNAFEIVETVKEFIESLTHISESLTFRFDPNIVLKRQKQLYLLTRLANLTSTTCFSEENHRITSDILNQAILDSQTVQEKLVNEIEQAQESVNKMRKSVEAEISIATQVSSEVNKILASINNFLDDSPETYPITEEELLRVNSHVLPLIYNIIADKFGISRKNLSFTKNGEIIIKNIHTEV